MAKITLTRDNKYVETPFTINVTGSNLKGKILKVYYAESSSGGWTVNFANRTINNNASYSASYTPTQTAIDNIYIQTPTKTEIKIIVEIYNPTTNEITTRYTFTTLLQIQKPTFDLTPTYVVTDSESYNFTHDTTKIINGMSTVLIRNITGEAYNYADIKYINVSGTNYLYQNHSEYNALAIENFTLQKDRDFIITLVDTRGVSSDPVVFQTSPEIISYHKPIITEMTVERDGISTATKLSVKGVYTEGYELGIEPLTPTYYYSEVGSGTQTQGTTQLTVTRTPSIEWQDYQAILEEYNNPNYIVQPDNVNIQYYTKTTFESDIQSLFETALKYNNKYTQEYLEQDYDDSEQKYYCLSSGYSTNGSWKTFWKDTLNSIKEIMYGTYIYGQQDKDYGNGGNYEFEIATTFIEGDILTGFTLDKTFTIVFFINDLTNKSTVGSRILPTAIPAIDVYKDKISLHGLYDETIDESDIQLWGNVFLNGSQINAGLLQMVQTANLDTLSTNYNYFPLFYTDSEIDVPISTTDKLVLDYKTISYGDRTNSTVYGVTIGSGVNLVRINFSARYLNNHTANQAISTSIFVYKNNSSNVVYGCSTTAGSNNRLTETGSYYLEVEEGDFVFLVGWRATKTADVDAIASNNAINMAVEIIS